MAERNQSAPLTFEMDPEMGEALQAFADDHSLRSVSAALRLILQSTDLGSLNLPQKETRQFSVRVPPETRDRLSEISKKKNTSIGEIIRTAVSRFLAHDGENAKTSHRSVPSSTQDERQRAWKRTSNFRSAARPDRKHANPLD